MPNQVVISTQTPELERVATDGQAHSGGTGRAIQASTGAHLVKMHKYSPPTTVERQTVNSITPETWVHITGHGNIENPTIAGQYGRIVGDGGMQRETTRWSIKDYARMIAQSPHVNRGDSVNIMMWVCFAGNKDQGLSMAEQLAHALSTEYGINANIIASKNPLPRYTGSKSEAELARDGMEYTADPDDIVVVRVRDGQTDRRPLGYNKKIRLDDNGPILPDTPLGDISLSQAVKTAMAATDSAASFPRELPSSAHASSGTSSKHRHQVIPSSLRSPQTTLKTVQSILEPYQQHIVSKSEAAGIVAGSKGIYTIRHSSRPEHIVIDVNDPEMGVANMLVRVDPNAKCPFKAIDETGATATVVGEYATIEAMMQDFYPNLVPHTSPSGSSPTRQLPASVVKLPPQAQSQMTHRASVDILESYNQHMAADKNSALRTITQAQANNEFRVVVRHSSQAGCLAMHVHDPARSENEAMPKTSTLLITVDRKNNQFILYDADDNYPNYDSLEDLICDLFGDDKRNIASKQLTGQDTVGATLQQTSPRNNAA